MIDDFSNQDGIESFRRLLLDAYPERKAGIDKVFGQTAARGAAQGFAKAVVTEGVYAYPSANGSFVSVLDWAEGAADEIRSLREEVEALREQALRGPFA